MIITADLIEAYLKCPTKCFLLSRDEVETGNAYAEWARVKSASFCREGIGRLVAGVAPDKCVMSASATENPQWQLAIDFKARSQNLQCSCQALERIPSSERERAARFIPIRFVFRNNVARDDKLLITFNALVLSERLGRTIDYGKVLYGDNYASLRVKISAFADDVRRIQQQRHLHRTQLSYTFRPRHRPKALRDKREKYHHSLKARAIRRYAGPPDGLGVSKALETSINLLSVIFGQIYFPTYSNRLKEIAGWLGFKWSEQEASGLQAIIWRQEWEQTRARLEKEKLVRYNVEDCAALELVTGAVGQIVQENIEGNSGTRDRIEVVVANNVDRKETIWPRFSSSIEGFDIVNRAARWDYQRDHIYIRTEAKLKRDKQVGQTLPRRNIRISKVMVCEPLPSCPRCQRKGTQMFRKIIKCLQDLRLSRFGVHGSVVKYRFQVFWCPTCQAFTPWPTAFWERSTYGRSLTAFAIFEIIELCVSQRSVTHTLNRLFGFRIDEIVVRRFKTRGAEYYRETRQSGLRCHSVPTAKVHTSLE